MRDGGQQIARVLRLRRKQNAVGWPLLDDCAGAHHNKAIAQEAHYLDFG